jgi:pimeloyl-ACP methyl ester carboxylesterase
LDDVVEYVGTELARRLGVSLYVFEYPGYSGSKGPDYQPNEAATYAAAETAYDDVTGRLGYPPGRIILYGKSLGSAVATYLAQQRPGTGALVLVSAIESVYRVALATQITLPFDVMRTVEMIGRQSSPVQLVHGTNDSLALPYNARKLESAALSRHHRTITYPICWIDGANHSFEMTDDGRRFTRHFDQLVECLRDGVMQRFV